MADCTQITNPCEKIQCLYPELDCDNFHLLQPTNNISATLKKEFNASTGPEGDTEMTITTQFPIPPMSTYSFIGTSECNGGSYGIYLEATNANAGCASNEQPCCEPKNSDGTYTYVLKRLVKNLKPYGPICPYDEEVDCGATGDQTIHTEFETLKIGDTSLPLWSQQALNCLAGLKEQTTQIYQSYSELIQHCPKHAGEIAIVPSGNYIQIYGSIEQVGGDDCQYTWASNFIVPPEATTNSKGVSKLLYPAPDQIAYNRGATTGQGATLDKFVDSLTLVGNRIFFSNTVIKNTLILLPDKPSTKLVLTNNTDYLFDSQEFIVEKQSDVIITTNIIGTNIIKPAYLNDSTVTVSYKILIYSGTGADKTLLTSFDLLVWGATTPQNYIGKTKINLPIGSHTIESKIYTSSGLKFEENSVVKIIHEIIGV